jgi:hypothetical protein
MLAIGRRRRAGLAAGVCVLVPVLAAAPISHADIDPLSGIDFVRVGAVGNAPWAGNGTVGDRAVGRGRVDYEYSIGRFEWTTSQAVEFFNAAYDRPADDRIPWLIPPDHWGAAATTPNTPGGLRWTVPVGNEMLPVGDISWRMAAIACNWYQNNKSTDRAAFLNGAYDVSTFGPRPDQPGFGDQEAHSPGARYWIPTWDEHLKASHYDPDKDGPGQGGWWVWNNGTDQFSTAGPPGVGQANYGFRSPSPFSIPLGAYTDVQSPWGLFDTAGATSEWTEEVRSISTGQRFRVFEGSYWTSSSGLGVVDAIWADGDDSPEVSTLYHGIRFASSIPGPSTVMVCASGCVVLWQRRTRSERADIHPA